MFATFCAKAAALFAHAIRRALALVDVDVDVLGSQQVSSEAVSLGELPSAVDLRTDPAAGVLPMSDGFKVTWVHAATVPTEVVDFKSTFDRPDEVLVGETVREHRTSWFPAQAEHRVTIRQVGAVPFPTFVWSSSDNAGQEPFGRSTDDASAFGHLGTISKWID
jgi:hypothetical protein